MNDLTNPISATPAPTVESLERQLQSLRKLFVVTLTILLVISGSVMVFLWGQKRILNSQLREAQKFVDDYEKVTMPFLNNFVSNLNTYAKTHPDINPVLDKFGVRPAVSNVPPPAASPVPKAPAPKAPKK
jgi:hypothetical protein